MKSTPITLNILIACCLLIISQAFAQKKEYYLVDSIDLNTMAMEDKILLDSLLPAYHKSKHDTSRLKIVSEIVEQCVDDDIWPLYNEFMYRTASAKLKMAKGKELRFYMSKQADAVNNMGFLYLNKGDSNKALEYFIKSLKINEKLNLKKSIANSLGNIGYVYKTKGEIAKALEHYSRGLKIHEELKDDRGIANDLNNIGLIYKNQGDSDKALEYYERSLGYWEKIGNTQGMAATLNNIGYIYSERDDINKALEYYIRTLKIDEANGDKAGIANSLNNIGLIYDEKQELDTALRYFNKSLAIYEQLENKKGISESLINLSRIYLVRENTKLALEHAKRSHEIATELGYPVSIRNSADLLARIYKKMGLWKEAYDMHVLNIQMRDSLFNDETQRAAVKQQMQYEYQKKEAIREIEVQRKAELAREQQKTQKLINYFALGGLGLVLIFSLFILNRFRVTQKQKGIIEKQKHEVDAAYDQLSEKNKEMIDSIRYAKRIQDAMLKEQDHISNHLPEHFVFFKPKDIVSGDFYWSHEHKDWWYLAAADCTGHGVPGAFLTMLGTAFLNEIVSSKESVSPAEVLGTLREKIVKELSTSNKEETDNSSFFVKDGMDISLMRYNLKTRELQWAGANNPLWILTSSKPTDVPQEKINYKPLNDEFTLIELLPDKQPIGHYPNPKPFKNITLEVPQNSFVYLFTDGYADQFGGEQGKKFKYKPLQQKLLALTREPMSRQKTLLNEHFNKWKGPLEQVDDVTLIGFKV